MAMDISNDATTYMTCPSKRKPDRPSPDVKPCKRENVKDYTRSRFDEMENYKQVGHVGSGSYGNCLLLQKRSNSTLRVCKVQKRRTLLEPLEIGILRDILGDHPRIVRLHDAIMHTQRIQLYFDYYPGGDLFKVIARYYEVDLDIPESFIWHCFLQLSEALAYIHHGYDLRRVNALPPASEWRSIIHGDIKPENIFLGPPTPDSHGYPSLVLGDFGLATTKERPVCGTWMWQPPELPMTSMKADVWALGAVIHALALEGQAPLGPRPEGMKYHDYYRWPAAREPKSLEVACYSTELHSLVVYGTLAFDPRVRFTSLEVLQSVLVEVELGVASDMECEPLIGPDYVPKNFDENGVTENSDQSSEQRTQYSDSTKFGPLESTPYLDPMEYEIQC